MDNRRLFIFVIISLAIMIGWQYLFPAKPPKPAGPPAPPAAQEPAHRPAAAPPPARELPAESPEAGASPAAAASPAAPRVEAAREERVVLETALGRATFTNRGAQLVSFTLKRHRSAEGRDLELVQARSGLPHPFGLVGEGLAPHPVNDVLFAVGRPGSGAVTFRYSGPQGTAEKRFRFRPDGLLAVEVEVESRTPWLLLLGPGLRDLSAAERDSMYLRRSAVLAVGSEVSVRDPKEAEKAETVSREGLVWAGLQDNYYLVAAFPERGLHEALLQPVLAAPPAGGATAGAAPRFLPLPPEDQLTKEQKDLAREYLLLLAPLGNDLSLRSYWGDKELDRLAAHGLEDSVDLGVFGFLARPLLLGLRWIHDNIVANYGWAIILMTVLIKVLLLPLTHKSYVSMQKMQRLNPKMQAIRDKYRAKLRDKQGRPNLEAQRKMNEEIMGLYKSEGVNPAGGCLPMLLQLPILFAFYNLLTAAVELRNAPWLLWIHDLSTKDPYYVLPIVMAGTQYLQTRMTPMTGDPMQRRIFQLMPLFMLFFFLPSPSGLVLYWLTNNVLTIIQQGVYNRLRKRQEA